MSFNSHSPTITTTTTKPSLSSLSVGGIERSNKTTAATITTGTTTTTTTTTTGQVKSIKNKFENLNNTLVVIDNVDNISLSKKCPKNIPSYKLQRASTSFELITKKHHSIQTNTKQIINNVRLPLTGGNHPYFEQKSQNKNQQKSQQTNIIIKRQASDSSLLKKPSSSTSASSRKLSGSRIFKPLTEIKENFEQQIVDLRTRNDIDVDADADDDGDGDPLLKRSSNIIKRSPAFRFGDKQNKVQLTKLSPVIADAGGDHDHVDIVDDQFKNKFEKFFTEATGNSEYRVTDTIRAALKQPLPTGPPPKKPPRLFDTNLLNTKNITNNTNKNDIVQIFETNNNKNNNTNNKPDTTTTTTNDKKPNAINTSNHNRIEQLKKLTKQHIMKSNSTESKSEKSVNNFLNCIQCTNNSIYEQKLTQYTKMNTNDTANKEPIYMEPYGHLNSSSSSSTTTTSSSLQFNKSINDSGEIQSKNGKNTDDHKEIQIMIEKSDSNGHHSKEQHPKQSCACQHEQNKDSDLLHYMCTKIDDNFKPHTNSTDNDAINMYDEISILVNAAFEEPSPMTEPTTDSGHCSIETIASQSNIDLLNHPCSSSPIKISRSLTDKRKNYVRRVSQKNPNNCFSMSPSAYGSLIDQSFLNKTPLSTFSINDNDQQTDKIIETINPVVNNNNSNEDENGNERIVSDRINKFNQLINESNVNSIPSAIKKSPIKSNESNNNNKLINNETQLSSDKTHKLFQMCLLIGFNVSTNSAYIKFKFPCDEDPPKNIERFVFPDNFIGYATSTAPQMDGNGGGGCLNSLHQDYSLILTDFNGYRIYAYCRRILPETSEICLPLAYCIITEQRAPGFYFKLLKEIESRHGYTDFQIKFLLTHLQMQMLPEAGKCLYMKLPVSPRPKTVFITNPSITKSYQSITKKRLSLETNPKWLTETAVYEAFGNGPSASNANSDNNNNNNNCSTSDKHLKLRDELKKTSIEDYNYNNSNNNNEKTFDFGLIKRSPLESTKRCGGIKGDEVLISRPNDIRLESAELSDLFTALGDDLLITVFGSLLHERKVILYSKNMSLLSSCILGLQTILYPFQWQYTLITLLPNDLLEICQAPVPILIGILEDLTVDIEDGIYINLDLKMIVQSCGDEATILPTQLKDSLLLSLKLVNHYFDHGKRMSSGLISESFLRFYVELFAGYTSKQFEKESFIRSHPSQSIRLFLEWFVETAMFRHFVNSKYFNMPKPTEMEETIYAQFENRLMNKIENKTETDIGTILKNFKKINKKEKSFLRKMFNKN